ncbi:MAG: DUF4890 domain-containing protein [Bacteroidales bacterium]|nr:DUF4890 domain-containing protein [Bacteroidales bacterium]
MKRKIIFILCAIFAATTICTAQNNTIDKNAEREAKHAEMEKKATERMKKELSLSDEQTAKLEELNKEYLPKMRMGKPGMRRNKGVRPDSICPKKDCPKAKAECKKTEKCCKEAAKCEKAKECKKAKKFDKAKKNDKKFEKPTKEQMEKRRNEMRETRKAYNEKLNEILTPEQQEKLKSLRKERKEKNSKKNIK